MLCRTRCVKLQYPLSWLEDLKLPYLLLVTLSYALAAQPEDTRLRIAATLFLPDPAPALAPIAYGSFEPTQGVVAERITYATEFGMRIPAILYRPAKPSDNSREIRFVR